jgi:transcriptional regulator with XRE-family HTH domain
MNTPPVCEFAAAANELLRQALLRLIEIYVPGRYRSEREMAEALGILPAHFSQMKNGHRNIGKRSATKIENALGLETGGLFQILEKKNEPGKSTDIANISTRYRYTCMVNRALIDLTLSGNAPPAWATSVIHHQHKALMLTIAEALKNWKKEESPAE